MDDDHKLSSPPTWPEIVRKIRERTPARIFVERGAAHSTQMALNAGKQQKLLRGLEGVLITPASQ
jgi:hypothetical protein